MPKFLLVLVTMGILLVNFSYLYSSLVSVVVALFTMVVVLKFFIFYKYMVMLIYIGGVIVLMLYIPCSRTDVALDSNSYRFILISTSYCWLSLKSFVILLSVYLMIFIGVFLNFILFPYSMNLFKMSGSLRV